MENKVFEKEFLDGRYIITSSSDVFRVKDGKRKKVNKILTSKGKQVVYLDNGVSSRQYSVGKIVAQCFVDNPNHYSYVNYIDGDPTNNVYTNLVWSPRNVPRNIRRTKQQSETEALTLFLENTPANELSYNQKETIRRRLNGETYGQISTALHISKQAANRIILKIIGNSSANQAKISLIKKQIDSLSEKIKRKESRVVTLNTTLSSVNESLSAMKDTLASLTDELSLLEGIGESI